MTIDQWFDILGDDIIHMHFIDGNPYGHLIWGDGTHNLEEFLKAINRHGYKGYLGQEIGGLRKSPVFAGFRL